VFGGVRSRDTEPGSGASGHRSANGTPSSADDSELAGRHEAVCPWHNRDKEASFSPQ